MFFLKRREILDDIFSGVEGNEKKLIDPLLDEIVFLENQMNDLKKLPFIKVNAK